MKIVVTGAAGLVGQNLVQRLERWTGIDLVCIDKHAANVQILRQVHPELRVIEADLATPGPWEHEFEGADVVVIGHAQIGGTVEAAFTRNNIVATERILEAAARRYVDHLVHISSSVVNSAAVDLYTESKKQQEDLVRGAGIPAVILRPTLMFGWFDRKHLGWLARFMKKFPVFPIPGDGRFLRQPLYVGDFCAVIGKCIERRVDNHSYNISGQERIYYIDLMRLVKEESGAQAAIVKIPYRVFDGLLRAYALFDSDPPFTCAQLSALVTPDLFEVIDWPGLFGIVPTPLRVAVRETFNHPVYSQIELVF
jgi:nucleoside-diphosphate-sugar epimerase